MKKTIAIIGNGNMGQAIAQGLLCKKIVTKSQLILTNSQTNNNKDTASRADIIILAIKPQVMSSVLEEIKQSITDQLIISIAAGITIQSIQQTLNKKCAIIRVMPNLAAKVGQSMSVWIKNKYVSTTQQLFVKKILQTIGQDLQLQNEDQINIATAISGSGPAYYFYLTEILEKEAIEFGFSQEEAGLLAKKTLIGAAYLLEKSEKSTRALQQSVTSKGGTTEAALKEFKKAKVEKGIIRGIRAAYARAKRLGLH